MKHYSKNKWRFTLVILLMAGICLLSACHNNIFTEGDATYTVDASAHTISDNHTAYQYEYNVNQDGSYGLISYPDGCTFKWERGLKWDSGTYTGTFREKEYTDGATLVRILGTYYSQENADQSSRPIWPGLLVIILGGIYASVPKLAWKMNIGWLFKDGEPSLFALIFFRLLGCIMAVLGIVLLFV